MDKFYFFAMNLIKLVEIAEKYGGFFALILKRWILALKELSISINIILGKEIFFIKSGSPSQSRNDKAFGVG